MREMFDGNEQHIAVLGKSERDGYTCKRARHVILQQRTEQAMISKRSRRRDHQGRGKGTDEEAAQMVPSLLI